MTKQEFGIFASALKTAYPRENLLPNTQAMEIWYNMLSDIPYEVASAALKQYLVTNKWSPTIADIREQVALIQNGEIADYGEGWGEVVQAISRYGMYREAEAMESMSAMTRECVKRLGFQNLCLSDNQMSDRANFRMIWEQLSERKMKHDQTPPALAELISSLQIGSSKPLTGIAAGEEHDDQEN